MWSQSLLPLLVLVAVTCIHMRSQTGCRLPCDNLLLWVTQRSDAVSCLHDWSTQRNLSKSQQFYKQEEESPQQGIAYGLVRTNLSSHLGFGHSDQHDKDRQNLDIVSHDGGGGGGGGGGGVLQIID